MMHKKQLTWVVLGILCAQFLSFPWQGCAEAESTHAGIQWQAWSDDVFTQAKRENKPVILDLEAVWCHWCHVMDEKTYHFKPVQDLITQHYIAVRVDEDSRPDLANRYIDYGWPATIVFAPDGTEIVKRSGYIEPEGMQALLEAILKDPTPETDEEDTSSTKQSSTLNTNQLSAEFKHSLQQSYRDDYDVAQGSWGKGSHKFLDTDSVEYALMLAKRGDLASKKMAQFTLAQQRHLLDPVWGGMYQYSTGGVWTHPHFEKIMSVQTDNLRIAAQAYSLWNDPADLATAQSIYHYLKTFLWDPNGGFYTSQDADLVQGKHSEAYFSLDDIARRAQGIPLVDRHQYARENGWVINALAYLYAVNHDQSVLQDALTAAQWVLDNRSLSGGGFKHDIQNTAGPYLGDTLSMGRAFLSLYFATGSREWLKHAEQASQFIETQFKNTHGLGYVSAVSESQVIPSQPSRDENQILARWSNLLAKTTGNTAYRHQAEQAMGYLIQPSIANIPYSATVLLADMEFNSEPTHITVVGHKDNPQAKALYQAALQYPLLYKRLDWWDKREGAMPNPDIQYPELDKPAAFVCTQNRCSLPVFASTALAPLVDRLTAPPKTTVEE